MSEFFQGLLIGITILGGLCAFNYWMFYLLEKKLDSKSVFFFTKIDRLADDIQSIVLDLKEDRRNKDRMYQFILDSHLAHEAKISKKEKVKEK